MRLPLAAAILQSSLLGYHFLPLDQRHIRLKIENRTATGPVKIYRSIISMAQVRPICQAQNKIFVNYFLALDRLGDIDHPTLTGTRVMVSLPKMSMTLTATA